MFLIDILVVMGAMLAIGDCARLTDPLVQLTASLIPQNWTRARQPTGDLVVTPDGRLFIGGGSWKSKTPGLKVTQLLQPSPLLPVDAVPDVVMPSMALLSNDQLLVVGYYPNMSKVLDISGETATVVKSIDLSHGRDNYCCVVVAYNPDDDTIIVSGQDSNTAYTYFEVMSRDGVFEDTPLAEVEHVNVWNMVVNKGDVYISLNSEFGPNLRRLNLASKEFLDNIGNLSLAKQFPSSFNFGQAAFDSHDNLYISGDKKFWWSFDDPEEVCCECVLKVTPEGNVTLVVNSVENGESVEAVTTTPTGLAVAWMTHKGYYTYSYKRIIEFYDFSQSPAVAV